MDILLLLIPCAMILGVIALAAFFWTLTAHQYDDLDGAAERILLEDDYPPAAPPEGGKGSATRSR